MNTNRHEDTLKQTVLELTSETSLCDLCHIRLNGEPLPSQTAIKEIIYLCRAILFPGFFGNNNAINTYNIGFNTGIYCERLFDLLENQITAGLVFKSSNKQNPDLQALKEEAQGIAIRFLKQLPELRRVLHTDVCATFRGDPAAVSTEEVIYCYPGIRAISNYRIAHALLKEDVPIIPRIISEQAHSETGIDIHPEAIIGEYFSIDHGTGVVIGATSIIGNNVKLYQGVTLGAKSFEYDENNNPIKGVPRHPIIGDNVIIYSNTSILGRITIGKNAIIGGNIWVTEDVAENERLVQAKANNILRFKQDKE